MSKPQQTGEKVDPPAKDDQPPGKVELRGPLSDQFCFGPEEWAEVTGFSRTFIFGEIKAKRLMARKAGRRTVILRDDGRAWLMSLPEARA